MYVSINCRFDATEVEGPKPQVFDKSLDEMDHTVDKWKQVIWDEVVRWKEEEEEREREKEKEKTSKESEFMYFYSLQP